MNSDYDTATQNSAWLQRKKPGLLRVSGKDHIDLLHRLTTNELRHLKPGAGQINVFTNEVGRIVDRVRLLKLAEEVIILTSFDYETRVAAWLDKYIFIEDVKVAHEGEAHAMLSVLGPKSAAILAEKLGLNVSDLETWSFARTEWQGGELLLQRSHELHVAMFDLIAPRALEDKLRSHLQDVPEIGEQTYEVLRLESGWPVPGRDFDDQINPHEAGMRPFINLDKGCYIGQEVIARLDTYDKVQKHLMGLILEGDALPEPRSDLYIGDKKQGWVTSSVHSGALNKNIALCYVKTKAIAEGVAVEIDCNGARVTGKLVPLPFVPKRTPLS